MKIGDTIKIRNEAGILTVKIKKQLSLKDISRGFGNDKLPNMAIPRLEYHKGKYDQHIITLYDESTGLPGTMYILNCIDYDDPPKAFLGIFETDEEDENLFETIT